MIPLLLGLAFSVSAFIGTINTIAAETYFVCPEPVLCGKFGQAITPHIDQDSKEFLTGWCNQQRGTEQACK